MIPVTSSFCRGVAQILSEKGLLTPQASLAQVAALLSHYPEKVIDAFTNGTPDSIAAVEGFRTLLARKTHIIDDDNGALANESAEKILLEMAQAMISAGIDVFDEMVPEKIDLEVFQRPADNGNEKEKTWILQEVEAIGPKRLTAMAQSASLVRLHAYQPYSNYSVGAVVLCNSGRITRACNGENVTYTLTDHAEMGAISQAVQQGEVLQSGRRFVRAVVISHNDSSFPCGLCRQKIIEHCDNALIVDANADGQVRALSSMGVLLPYPFTPTALGIP